MSDDRIGKVLERVAAELSASEERWFNDDELATPHVEMVIKVLEARLGPLLRAGHAMRNDLRPGNLLLKSNSAMEWDAALNELTGLAALEDRDGK